MSTITKLVTLNQCWHCLHAWQQRKQDRPEVCPKCKRRDWDVPKG